MKEKHNNLALHQNRRLKIVCLSQNKAMHNQDISEYDTNVGYRYIAYYINEC